MFSCLLSSKFQFRPFTVHVGRVGPEKMSTENFFQKFNELFCSVCHCGLVESAGTGCKFKGQVASSSRQGQVASSGTGCEFKSCISHVRRAYDYSDPLEVFSLYMAWYEQIFIKKSELLYSNNFIFCQDGKLKSHSSCILYQYIDIRTSQNCDKNCVADQFIQNMRPNF